jgi:UDPglucose--hexose-1-phosphate uridylyltransferase
VDQTEHFVAITPYASCFPFEVWIMPKPHQASFRAIGDPHRLELAGILQRVLRRHKLALGNPPFNYMFHSSPFGLEKNPEYDWHLEIIPRLTNIAGFEWGTGFYINPTAPEEAASVLRAVDLTAKSPVAVGSATAG